jgi:CO dehydrogenase maturation factor
MKFAVSGKGGVGKTLVAGVLATFFAEKGFKVLAIDADPSPNLALTLGISPDEAKKIVPISENTQLIESKTKTDYSGVYRLSFSVDDIVKDFSVKTPYNVNLLVMGTVRSAGTGCLCPANAVVRALLQHLYVERSEVVVMDMEAGVEHLGRGTAKHVDAMLLITDSSFKAMETAKKIYELTTEMGIKKLFLIGNKIANANEGKLIEKFAENNNILLLGLIPYDKQIVEADIHGESPIKHVSKSKGIAVIRQSGESLIKQIT